MSILTLQGLSQAYGDFDVFVGVSCTIPNDGKVGLVGANGVGKTTLLRILAGLDVPSAGDIHIARDVRVGYLRQEAMDAFVGRDNTIIAEMLTVFASLKKQEAAMRDLEHRMASGEGEGANSLMDEYSTALEAFERAGGYDYEVRISQVLQGLGFGRDEWETPLSHLSGGQKTRALLARLLLERPDLLILDEPTNHLDVEAIEWLESTLRTWEGALLIVSHDRYFLDRVVNNIWEMSRGGVEEYRGNYTAYLNQRQERWALREGEFDTIKDKFMRELDYVKRNIARDSTTNMAKGRLKRLIREVKVVEAGGLQALNTKTWSRVMAEVDISSTKWNVADVESHIKGLQSPVQRPPQLGLRLDTDTRSGNIVLRSTELSIGYPGAPLFSTDPILLHRRECAAMIGPNGTGKTTFLRTLMGQLQPLEGEIFFGASLQIGYFAQAHDKLNPENTVLDELIEHKHMMIGEARSFLAQYLFRGEDVFNPISTLSGGERARLALAILSLDGANFLLLDEPTNHLDIPAQEVLQEVLERFAGTILLVSHDRYLVDRLASQIWELRDGEMTVSEGTYADFLAARGVAVEQKKAVGVKERMTNGTDQRTERARQNQARKQAQALAKMEDQVHALEEKLAKIEHAMADASQAQDLERLQRLNERYTETHTSLEIAMDKWTMMAEA